MNIRCIVESFVVSVSMNRTITVENNIVYQLYGLLLAKTTIKMYDYHDKWITIQHQERRKVRGVWTFFIQKHWYSDRNSVNRWVSILLRNPTFILNPAYPIVWNVSEQEINAQIRSERNGVAVHRRTESIDQFVNG